MSVVLQRNLSHFFDHNVSLAEFHTFIAHRILEHQKLLVTMKGYAHPHCYLESQDNKLRNGHIKNDSKPIVH